MTLHELVVNECPQLLPELVKHTRLADIFIISYNGQDIGYYDPENAKIQIDSNYVNALVEV